MGLTTSNNPVIRSKRYQRIFDHLRDYALLSLGVDTEWSEAVVDYYRERQRKANRQIFLGKGKQK